MTRRRSHVRYKEKRLLKEHMHSLYSISKHNPDTFEAMMNEGFFSDLMGVISKSTELIGDSEKLVNNLKDAAEQAWKSSVKGFNALAKEMGDDDGKILKSLMSVEKPVRNLAQNHFKDFAEEVKDVISKSVGDTDIAEDQYPILMQLYAPLWTSAASEIGTK